MTWGRMVGATKGFAALVLMWSWPDAIRLTHGSDILFGSEVEDLLRAFLEIAWLQINQFEIKEHASVELPSFDSG